MRSHALGGVGGGDGVFEQFDAVLWGQERRWAVWGRAEEVVEGVEGDAEGFFDEVDEAVGER